MPQSTEPYLSSAAPQSGPQNSQTQRTDSRPRSEPHGTEDTDTPSPAIPHGEH